MDSIFTFLSVFLFPQRVFAPVICSSTMSSSTQQHAPHGRSVSLSSYHSRTRYDEGRPSGVHFSDGRRKERGEAEGGGIDGGGGQAASLPPPASQSLLSGSPATGTGVLSLASNPAMGSVGAVRVASTVVTNVMRPVISTPLPIASKPREGSTSSSPHPPERKSLTPQQQPPQLLIGSGGGAAGGGGYFASSSPNPMAAGPGGVVTNLVLGGTLSAQPAVQLISPSPQPQPPQHQTLPTHATAVSAPHGHTNGPLPLPLLQPQFLPTSSLAPPGGKGITQVQYILPTLPAGAHPKSPPQQLNQTPSIFNLPTAPPTQHVSLANGKQQVSGSLAGFTSSQAVGVVSPGARGETRVYES